MPHLGAYMNNCALYSTSYFNPQEMEQLQQTLSALEEQLSDPGLYEDGGKARLKELLGEQATATARLEEVEAQWLEVSEEVESLEAELAG